MNGSETGALRVSFFSVSDSVFGFTGFGLLQVFDDLLTIPDMKRTIHPSLSVQDLFLRFVLCFQKKTCRRQFR